MANLNETTAIRDSGVTVALNDGAATQTYVADNIDEKTCILIDNTSSTTAATVTISKGTGNRSVIGDSAPVSVPASSKAIIGPLDSMRFKKLSDGTVTINLSGPSPLSAVKVAIINL